MKLKHHSGIVSNFDAEGLVMSCLAHSSNITEGTLEGMRSEIACLAQIVGRIMERSIPEADWLEVTGAYHLEKVA